MATWQFSARDNGGKYQTFKVKANSKTEAIAKGIEKANKNAAGDFTGWDCRLIQA